MTTLFILIALLIISILYGSYNNPITKKYNKLDRREFFEVFGKGILILLITHSILFFTTSISFEKFNAERNALQETLNNVRENNYEYEIIMRKVSKMNKKIEIKKVNNKTFFIGQYVDDRFENLKPIK